MKLIALMILMVLAPLTSLASTSRVLSADQITTSDGTKTFTLPAASTALVGANAVPVAGQIQVDSFIGNGSTTALTLSVPTGTPSASGLSCTLDGILQDLTTDYTYTAGTATVTFLTAPLAGQRIKCAYSKY